MSSDPKGVKHIYDGIEEQDNVMPNWWLGILFGSIVFALGYWGYYETFRAAPGPEGEYALEVAAFEASKPRVVEADDATLEALVRDPELLRGGAQVFTTNCASCHGMKAEGIIGPNLTDGHWLHGARPSQIQKAIAGGVLDKGMPSWEPALGPERVKQVTAYVLSVRGTNLAGKAPQGELAPK